MKDDVLAFAHNVEENLLELQKELSDKVYDHSQYQKFILCDPKRRVIHKATVRDRVVHHAIVRVLEAFFEKKFIPTSFASRKGKGLHKGVKTLQSMMLHISHNGTKEAWYLKCDIKKFFDSVDHEILSIILERSTSDVELLNLLQNIIDSFHTTSQKGVPLGNYTSQLLANIYLNELDQYIKRALRVKSYIRYCDDFILLAHTKEELESQFNNISNFLWQNLQLEIHDEKTELAKISQGIDFLGYVSFLHHSVVRTRTKKRILKKFVKKPTAESLASYAGITKHAQGNGLRRKLERIYRERSGDRVV